MTFTEVEDEHGVTHEVGRKEPKQLFPGAPSVLPGGQRQAEEIILQAAHEAGDEDTFYQDIHMDVDRILDEVSIAEVLHWYVKNQPLAFACAGEYIGQYWDDQIPAPAYATEELLRGGLQIAVTEYLVTEVFDHLVAQKRLPWQQPECFYCSTRSSEMKKDRINQPTCQSCWDTGVDGPWDRG